jgi:hypothetical protein
MLYYTVEEAKKALAGEKWATTMQAAWFVQECTPDILTPEFLALVDAKKCAIGAFKPKAQALKNLLEQAGNKKSIEFERFGRGYNRGDVVNVPVVWVYSNLTTDWEAKPVNRKGKHFFDKECQKNGKLTKDCDGSTVRMVCTGGNNATYWAIV